MSVSFDVVTVPDFRPGPRPGFETRSLFFLAGWIESGGAASGIPLHLVCIGEPPVSVRRLAEEANASVTVRNPLEAEERSTSNKIRGLEAETEHDQVLLVDTDVLFLRDPSEIGEFGRSIAAAPLVGPKMPAPLWRRVYEASGLEPPEERIPSVRGETDCALPGRALFDGEGEDAGGMFPAYNAGVLWLPRDREFPSLWEEGVRVGARFVDPRRKETEILGRTDEVGLAVAVETMRRRGVPFRRLPPRWHGTWLHLYRRVLPADEIRLFHAFRFAERPRSGPRSALRRYEGLLGAGLLHEAFRQDIARGRPGRALRDLPGAFSGARFLVRHLRRLLVGRVLPAAARGTP